MSLEDIEDYRAFEASITADYDAQMVVERELVLRLSSLPWRLRRGTAIETDLLQIRAEILRDHQQVRVVTAAAPEEPPNTDGRAFRASFRPNLVQQSEGVLDHCDDDHETFDDQGDHLRAPSDPFG